MVNPYGWAPRLNARGRVCSSGTGPDGITRVAVDGNVLHEGGGPIWLDYQGDTINFNTNNGSATILWDLPTGQSDVVPIGYGYRVSGGGRWAGARDGFIDIYEGTTHKERVTGGAPLLAAGRFSYQADDNQRLVLNGATVFAGPVFHSALTDTHIGWVTTDGVYVDGRKVSFDGGEREGSIFLFDEWVMTYAQKGSQDIGYKIRPIGETAGYLIRTGDAYYPDVKMINGRIVFVASDRHGEPIRLEIDPTAPRIDLRVTAVVIPTPDPNPDPEPDPDPEPPIMQFDPHPLNKFGVDRWKELDISAKSKAIRDQYQRGDQIVGTNPDNGQPWTATQAGDAQAYPAIRTLQREAFVDIMSRAHHTLGMRQLELYWKGGFNNLEGIGEDIACVREGPEIVWWKDTVVALGHESASIGFLGEYHGPSENWAKCAPPPAPGGTGPDPDPPVDVEALKRRIAELEGQLTAARTENEALRAVVEDRDRMVAGLTRDLERVTRERDECRAQQPPPAGDCSNCQAVLEGPRLARAFVTAKCEKKPGA